MSKARWGIGALELNKQKTALPGEIMVDSELGVFAVKSYNGSGDSADKVVSYEYITKVKQSFLEFKNALVAVGRVGKITKIDIGDYVGPFAIESGKSYSADSLNISEKKLNYFQFYFDIDVVNNETGLIEYGIEPTIRMSLGLAHNNVTGSDNTFSFTNLINELNAKSFIPDYTNYITGNISYNFHVNTLSITLPAGYDAKKYKIVLHSLFVAYQEVE